MLHFPWLQLRTCFSLFDVYLAILKYVLMGCGAQSLVAVVVRLPLVAFGYRLFLFDRA